MIRALVAAVALAAAAAPAPAQAATPVPILLYHHVADQPPRSLNVPPRLFARQVAALDRAGYTAITLARAQRHWRRGTALPRRPVVLSFDDGYADQYTRAAKALRARRWPGVLYLQTERLGVDGGLTTAQVKRMLRDGWELGAHSVTHADLTTLDDEALAAEVAGSRAELRRIFRAPVDSFAYPYGRHDAAVRTAVRDAGFQTATTTRSGAASADDDPHALDRIIVNANFSPARLLRTLRATSHRR
jgi:peptidoglycan/xylan/chitin deacetylase (PgdA/CDA1 family)